MTKDRKPKKPAKQATEQDCPSDLDIQDVIQQERARGVKHVEPEIARRKHRLMQDLSYFLRKRDEKGFLATIRALGVQDGTPEFERAWKIYRGGGS